MGEPEKWQKRGRAKWVLSHFCRLIIKSHRHILKSSTFKFELFSGDFLFCFPPCLFTVHIRPVLSPCQASNTSYISTCFSNKCTINNIINTICTLNVYIIMLAPLCILGITGFCLTIFVIDTIKYMRL